MKKKTRGDSSPPDRLRILFADDERTLQELMSLELPRMGHEVTVCPDGLTAVAAMERNTYDCLIVDLEMPGRSGVEVIAKAKELSPDTEAIVLTGKSSLQTAVAALRHGAFDYLTKPCRLIDLQTLLSRVAERRELGKKLRALKQWSRNYDNAVDPLAKGLESLRYQLDHEMPKGISFLLQAQKTLEGYAETGAPGAEPAPEVEPPKE